MVREFHLRANGLLLFHMGFASETNGMPFAPVHFRLRLQLLELKLHETQDQFTFRQSPTVIVYSF